MAKRLIPDDVWRLVEPLLPQRARGAKGGRPPVADRDVLTGILFVLKAGIAWEDLPEEMGCGCGMTCLRRLREWQAIGVWPQVERVLIAYLPHVQRIDWSRIADETFKAPGGSVLADVPPAPVDARVVKPGASAAAPGPTRDREQAVTAGSPAEENP